LVISAAQRLVVVPFSAVALRGSDALRSDRRAVFLVPIVSLDLVTQSSPGDIFVLQNMGSDQHVSLLLFEAAGRLSGPRSAAQA